MHHVFVGHVINFCTAVNCLLVWIIIFLLNVHNGHFLMTVLVWSSYAICSCIFCLYLITFYLLFIHVLYSTCFIFNEAICYVQVFQDTSVYSSSASHFLDLGVSKFCLYSHSHILTLKSIQGFCHRVAKGEDCKVVFYNYVLCLL